MILTEIKVIVISRLDKGGEIYVILVLCIGRVKEVKELVYKAVSEAII